MIAPIRRADESPWGRQLRKVWTTRGARLEAYRRLSRTGTASRWVVTVASLLLVCLALADAFGLLGPASAGKPIIDFLAAVGAVTILVVSAMEHGKSYELRADRHHQAALLLGRLYDQANGGPVGQDALDRLVAEYNVVLDRFVENHEPIDYEMFAIRQSRDFSTSWLDRMRARVLWHGASQRPWLIIALVLGMAWVFLRWAGGSQ